MLQSGLVDEVRQLQELGYTSQLNALRTVGYQEVFDYLNASFDFGTMTDKIKMNTRRYAKRQLTWFRKESRIHWFSLDIDSTSIIAEKVAALYTL